jgi:hypothetical protein
MKRLIEWFSLPVLFLNLFGGIIAGIWLAILGEWKLIGIGIGLMIFSTYFLSMLLMPGLLLLPIASALRKKRNSLVYVVGYFSQLWTNLVIVVSCAVAFLICVRFYDGSGKTVLIPYLLWSWGMALGPWQSMASSEKDNEFTIMTLLCATFCYMVFLFSLFLGGLFPTAAIALFLLLQLIVLPFFNLWILSKTETTNF